MHNQFYDRYEIIKELSSSSHSNVYLVRHRMLDVYRVAKVFKGAFEESERLLKEARLIKNLKHPHIPIIYDIEQNIGEDNDSICIIEEYIDGKSLRQYVEDEVHANGHMSVKDICQIGIELCCILEYLHKYNEQGILHMDIKPDNIMINKEGEVKLIDFDNAVYKNAGVAVDSGSPLYAAPEQYSGEEAVEQSDIYSLGMVILFMVSHGHISTDRDHNISGISKRYAQLYHLINKSLHHEWSLRYGSVALMREELQSIIMKNNGTNGELSYVIQTAGVKSGIGTTHAVMCMAHFFQKNGYKCVVIDRSGGYRLLTEALKGTLSVEGAYIYKGITIIPDYAGAISVSGLKADIVIVDSGCGKGGLSLEDDIDIVGFAGNNYTSLQVMVADKYSPVKECLANKNGEDIVYMLNLVSAEQYYELVSDRFRGKKCYRIPCIYDCYEDNPIFDETMNDFLQDKLSGLGKVYKPGRIKECICRLYESFENIRFIMFKKKKGGR